MIEASPWGEPLDLVDERFLVVDEQMDAIETIPLELAL